jgi:hypothetical protein
MTLHDYRKGFAGNYNSISAKAIDLFTKALIYCNRPEDSIYCLEIRSYVYYSTLNKGDQRT